MTNFEKYKDEILKIIESGSSCCIAVKDGKPVRCESMPGCDNCELNTEKSNCGFKIRKGYEGWDGCDGCVQEESKVDEWPCTYCRRRYSDYYMPR